MIRGTERVDIDVDELAAECFTETSKVRMGRPARPGTHSALNQHAHGTFLRSATRSQSLTAYASYHKRRKPMMAKK
jgi:hypothetical protein